jgi:conjugative relaxase-like TrwC/TraI family protein
MIRQTHLTRGKGKKGSPQAVANYEENQHDPEKAVGYYEFGAQREWLGKGAEEAGLRGEIDKADMIRILSGIAPDGTDISKRGGQNQESRRFGEELTVSAPKSVSVMSVRDRRIVAAHQAAVRDAIAYVEKHMVYARMGKGGVDTEFTGNIIAGRYTHEDSRPDEKTGRVSMHLHDHVVIANMTRRSDGKWVALKIDWGHNNEKKMLADAIYKASLAKRLRRLGYEIERERGFDFEIKGITREQIAHFSPRSENIKEEIGGERNSVSAKAREAAQNKTRLRKNKQIPATEQRFAWLEEMREVGLDAQGLQEEADRRAAAGVEYEMTAEQAVQSAIRHLSERDTTFSKDALRQVALAAGIGQVTLDEVDQAIDARAGGLLHAGRGEGLQAEQFTTRAAVLREAEILARASEGRGKAEAIINDPVTEPSPKIFSPEKEQHHESKRDETIGHYQSYPARTPALSNDRLRVLSSSRLDADTRRADSGLLQADGALDRPRSSVMRRAGDEPRAVKKLLDAREEAQGWKFSLGQRAAVNLALTSEDRHLGIVGYAGAGKTTAMSVIVEQYKQAGYEVIGVAPSAAAARELESAGCDKTQTLAAALLEKRDPEDTQKRLYVLDEAGMVSARDFDRFYRKADQENARTLSVGDPLQLQSVEAGTAFKQLLETGALEHVKIDEIQRQRDPQLREIATAFARGDAEKAVELAKPYMRQVGKSELTQTAADAYLSLSKEDREKTLLLVGTNKTRQEINNEVRKGLIQEGTLGKESVTVTALDKMDLTKEQIKQSANFQSDDGKQVVVAIREKDGSGKSRQELYDVVDTKGGMLTLRSKEGNRTELVIDPAKKQIEAAFTERQIELRDGEKIMFRQNDKDRDITNGNIGTVHIRNGKAQAKIGDKIVDVGEKPTAFDYAYARTIHSSQGATVERAIVVGEANRVATAEAGYVACSREKTGLEIITNDTEKLGQVWKNFSKRQKALEAAKQGQEMDLPRDMTLAQIRAARREADRELEQGDKVQQQDQRRDRQQDQERDRQQAARQRLGVER